MDISKKKVQSDFVAKVEELSGQQLLSCFQCGKCSAGCPVVGAMDILPNQVIRLAQLGFKEEALEAKAPWSCASCFTCFSRCPRGVDLSKVMEALRVMLLRPRVSSVDSLELPSDFLKKAPQQAFVSSWRKFTS